MSARSVGRPEPLEGGVGGIGEAVAVAEVVQPALAVVVVREPEAHEPADAVRVPGHRLRQRELVVVGRIAERGVEAITHAEHQPSEHVRAALVASSWRAAWGPRARRSRR